MPVIKKERKDLNQVSQTRIQEINQASRAEETAAQPVAEEKKSVEQPAAALNNEIKQDEKPSKQKEIQINMKLPANVKTKWKKFFVENNLNITQGIIFAVENLIQEVNDGEATLTIGGVYKKK